MSKNIKQQTKSLERASLEVRDVYREMAQTLNCHYSPTSETVAILTLAAIINMSSKPIYIVHQDAGKIPLFEATTPPIFAPRLT